MTRPPQAFGHDVREGSEVSIADKTLTCRDCASDFVFSAGEQAFFAERGLLNQPQRCHQCRVNRRRERQGEAPRELHQVPCHECGTTALVVGIAIAIDNISEAMSIGALAREDDAGTFVGRTLRWTGLIGLSLIVAGLGGWALLRNLPQEVLSFLLAVGAGAMLYLTTTDLLPSAEEHQYQQSAALAVAAGFLTALVLSQF